MRNIIDLNKEAEVPNYLMLDYSDLVLIQQDPNYKQQLDNLKAFENENFINQTPIYNKNNIKVFKLE